ncbi:MAG: DUF3570 domain-containing protein [Nannocystaceae bacterium]|nr:DUF3570 domain-containing protein [Myxococcales bacterium]
MRLRLSACAAVSAALIVACADRLASQSPTGTFDARDDAAAFAGTDADASEDATPDGDAPDDATPDSDAPDDATPAADTPEGATPDDDPEGPPPEPDDDGPAIAPEPDDDDPAITSEPDDGDAPLAAGEPKPPAPVDGDVELRTSLYVDSDHTWVSTSTADATLAPGEIGLTLRAGYTADVVSSASVDVVSAATDRWDELRNQASGGINFYRDEWTADVGYTFSDENDWTSHTASASLGRDLFTRKTNLTGGYVFVFNQVYRADDDNFRDKLLTHAANLTLTQVLGKRTNSRLAGFFSYNDGFQSSPYRYVPVGVLPGFTPDPKGTCMNAASCPRERHPDERLRFALAPSVIHYVGKRRPASLLVSYRLYGDTWEVFSHTLELAYRVDLIRRLQLRLRSRTYFQDKAYFYEERYDAPLRYLSVDRELSTFLHQLTGIKLTYKSGFLRGLEDLRVDIKADFFYFEFFNFVRLPRRIGGIVELGLRLVF